MLLIVLLAIVSVSLSLVAPPLGLFQLRDDFVLVDYHNVSIPFSKYSFRGIVASTNTSYSAYVAVLPFGIPDMFSFELPQAGKSHKSSAIIATPPDLQAIFISFSYKQVVVQLVLHQLHLSYTIVPILLMLVSLTLKLTRVWVTLSATVRGNR